MTNPILKRRDAETEDAYLVRLYENKNTYNIDKFEIANLMNRITGKNCDESKWRKDYAQSLRWKSYRESQELNDTEDDPSDEEEVIPNYKEDVEILKDGSHKSNKLVKMSLEDSKDPTHLLESHGYNPDEWELTNAKNSMWNMNSKAEGVLTLFSSKITAKPKSGSFNFERFLETIAKEVKPIMIETKQQELSSPKLLEVALYDMHFGIGDLEYYESHLVQVVEKIRTRHWDKVLFVIGQDLLHVDNFKGQTANGTFIGKVDLEKAFNDALKFYVTLITEAVEKSNEVECIYVKGNHDESMAYGLFRTLQATFPNVSFVGNLKQRFAFTWEKVFIGLSHGDKGGARILENFISEYGKLITNSDVKEVHLGHFHVEKSKDQFGITQRTLSTANKTDDWHDENGFVGANKRFQLFEYSPSKLDSIHYIQK